jgi:hypothetical protein
VLSFTPDTEEALAVFAATYGVTTSGMGACWFERQQLPATGGAEDQPALLVQQLEWLERIHNEVLAERMKEREDRRKAAKKKASDG